MAEHTPGPWNKTHVETGWIIGPRQQNRGDYVADVHEHQSGAMTDSEAEANARLIAAAPLLLEACIEARAIHMLLPMGAGHAIRLCDAAIAAAKGES